jgi:predicted phosphodiesterase
MLLAILGDIDGNARALRATLDAIEEAGILSIAHTGNFVAGGPDGNEVIELLVERRVTVVQGERDRLVLRYRRKREALRQRVDAAELQGVGEAYERLTSAHLEYLRGLAPRKRMTIDGIEMLVCHGSPASQHEIIDADVSALRFQRLREIDAVGIVVCGGAPEPFQYALDDVLFAGPGRLDVAPGRARYMVVSTEAEPWRADVVEVNYGCGSSSAASGQT